MNKYIMLDMGSSIAEQYTFSDCMKMPNFRYERIFKKKLRRVVRGAIKAHASGYFPFSILPVEWFVNRELTIKPTMPGENCWIIIPDSFLPYFSDSLLKRYLKSGYRLCLLFLNSIKDLKLNKTRQKLKLFGDYIYTFDPVDAEKYGFKYTDQYYSKIIDDETKPHNGVYFIGADKGRIKLLNKFGVFFEKNNIDACINVRGATQSFASNNMHPIETIPYPDSLREMLNYDTVLDVVTEGQHGASLRYFEAVVYNRKLITTNKEISNYRFFNPEYMKIVSGPEDVDIEWLKSDLDVEYHYDGSYSPVNFVDSLP